MKKLDLRSALLGLAAGVVVMAALGAATGGGPVGPVGRYQVGGTASHGIIVDTQTGKAWTAFFPQHGGGVIEAAFKAAKEQ